MCINIAETLYQEKHRLFGDSTHSVRDHLSKAPCDHLLCCYLWLSGDMGVCVHVRVCAEPHLKNCRLSEETHLSPTVTLM